MDPVSAALISWAIGQLGDAGLRGLKRLRGDAFQRALHALVREAIGYAVELAVVAAEREAVRDSLLRERPAASAIRGNDVARFDAAILRQLHPRLTALAEDGYSIDSELLARELVERIRLGIEADAARGGQLTPLAKLMQHKEVIEELRAVNRTLEAAVQPEIDIRRLAQAVSISTSIATDYSGFIQNFLTEYLGRADALVPFGGRGAEIDALDSWLFSDHAAPYLVVAGPAGRGKSALVVRWLTHIQQDPRVRVAFVPVSLRFGTASASVLFPALAARLAKVYDRPLPPATRSPSGDWHGIVADFLAAPVPEGKQVVVVVDGLDEAADWTPGPALFPLDPPEGLRLVVTARYLLGDSDAHGWAERLGWNSTGLAAVLDLGLLDQAGIAELLYVSGLPTTEGEVDLVEQLFNLTLGDPLLTGLYVTHLLRPDSTGVRLTASDLPRLPPGLHGYFGRWLEQQRQLWGDQSPLREPAAQSILNLLAVALGAISRDDLLYLVPLDSWTLDDTIRSFERFVIGDGYERGYVFSHPRFAEYIAGRMTAQERQRTVEGFLDWGAASLVEFNTVPAARQPPEYLSMHLADHLVAAGRLDDLLAIGGNRGWADGQLAKDPSGATLIHDLRVSFDTATSIDRVSAARGQCLPAIARELSCILTESTIRSLSQGTPTPIILALVDEGELTAAQALELAQLNPDIAARMHSVAAICRHCMPKNGEMAIMRRALESISVAPRDQLLRAFTAIAPHLPPALAGEALGFVRAFLAPNEQRSALVALAPTLDRDSVDQALSILRGSLTGLELAGAFAELLPSTTGAQRETLLGDALSIVRSQIRAEPDPQAALMLLVRLAAEASPEVRADLAAEALAAAPADLSVIADAAHYLPPAQGIEAFVAVINGLPAASAEATTQSRGNPVPSLLEAIGPYLPSELFPAVLNAIDNIAADYFRQAALEAIIPQLPSELLQRVLDMAQSLGSNARLQPQIDVVKRLVELGDIQMARRAADDISYWRTRDWGLGLVAQGMTQHGRAQDALALIDSLSDQHVRFSALGWVLKNLSGELRQEVISRAAAMIACAEIQVMLSDSSWLQAAKDLANQLAVGGEYATALELARALPLRVWDSSHPRADAMADLLQSAPDEAVAPTLEQGKIAARAIADYAGQAAWLCSIARILPGVARGEALRCAFQAALAITDASRRATVLIEILDDLASADRVKALDEIATCLHILARQPGENGTGLYLLSAVAGRLSESQVEMLLPLTTEHPPPHTVEEAAEAELIAILGPYLPTRLITAVRSRAEAITIDSRVEAMTGMLSVVSADDRRDLIVTLFSDIESMAIAPVKDAAQRLGALAGLIPHLGTAELAHATELIAAVEATAAKATKFFADEYWIGEYWKELTNALLALASHLIDADRPDEALAHIARIKDDYECNRALAVLVPRLPERMLSEVGDLAKIGSSSFGELVIALGLREPPDSEPQEWLVNAVVYAAQPGFLGDVGALGQLVPRLKPAGFSVLINFFQAKALPGHRAVGLAHLAPHAAAVERDQLFEMVMNSIENLDSGEKQGTVLSLIAQVLPEPLLVRATELATLIGNPGSAGSIYSRRTRARALSALAPRLAQLPKQQMQPIWEMMLPKLVVQEREDFLNELASLTPILAMLADAERLVELFTEIRDVLAHWP